MRNFCSTAALLVAVATAASAQSTEAVECEMGAVDLVFVVDDSGSIGASNFQTTLAACVTLADYLNIGPNLNESNVGFVEFDSGAAVKFGLSQYYTNAQVDAAIRSVPYNQGGTDIATGMQTAMTKVFDVRKAARNSILKMMVLLTDGQDGNDLTSTHAQAAARGITVYAIGVGTGVDNNELTQATGDPSHVFNVNDFSALKKAMGEICHAIATIAPPVTEAPKAHSPRDCACTVENIWLDIVVVLDSSNGVNEKDFHSVIALLVGFIMKLNIGQAEGKYTRLAIVSVASTAHRISNLTTYESKTEAYQALLTISFDGVSDLNIGAGLIEAWKIIGETDERTNVHNLVILFASNGMKCKQNKASENLATGDDDPCRVAAQMVEDPNTELMVVALQFYEDPTVPGLDFGSPCFYTVNDVNLMNNLQRLACKANCFCDAPYTQFISPTQECVEYGECVYPKGIATGYLSAQIGCQLDQTTLVDILNADKDSFLKKIAVKVEQRPYWIGLQKTNGHYKWDSGVELNSADYTGWASGQPNATKDDCVFVDKTGQGFNQAWYSDVCDWTSPSHYYFCQKHTCDTDTYCK